jgi:hypothetical protein
MEGGPKVSLFIDVRAGRNQGFDRIGFACEHGIMQFTRLRRGLK